MAKYVLCHWEINGYDDSDFMLTYYDDVTDSLIAHMYGTTRFGRCSCQTNSPTGFHVCKGENDLPEALLAPTKEIVEKARLKLEDYIFGTLKVAEEQTVMQPQVKDLYEGLEVRLKEKVRNQVFDEVPCESCKGTGKWVNAHKPSDVRQCFRCKGSGSFKGEKKRDEKGKVLWDTIEAGVHGKVVSWGSFGKFYKNGYNKPDEHNTSVVIRTPEEKVFRATLKCLRLHREVQPDSKVREVAKQLSFNYQFGSISRCAWLTENFAAKVVQS